MPDIKFFVDTLLFLILFSAFIMLITVTLPGMVKTKKRVQSTICNKLKLWYVNLRYKAVCTSDDHKPIIYRGKEARNLHRNLKFMFKDIK